jgi:hypothetical protein
MTDQSSGEQSPGARRGKSELLPRIHHSRSALEETLSKLTEGQLVRPGSSGWSIKDHLAHLATWESGIVELLQRRPRFAAMGVELAMSEGKGQDEINDLIYQQHAGLSLPQVMEKFRSVHRQLIDLLERLSDDDLYEPYASYVPIGDDRQDPVIYWIIGNTFGHYDEHHEYIRTILEEQ